MTKNSLSGDHKTPRCHEGPLKDKTYHLYGNTDIPNLGQEDGVRFLNISPNKQRFECFSEFLGFSGVNVMAKKNALIQETQMASRLTSACLVLINEQIAYNKSPTKMEVIK